MQAACKTRQYSLSRILCGKRLGKHEVLARIASGGMASVYVARSIGVAGFERLFAIKVLHPHLAHEREFIAMFLDEARLAARIRHANVLSAIDICDTPDTGYYLVMDYVEGDHLGALLRAACQTGSRIPLKESLRIAVDALAGLAAAHDLADETGHRLNLVHRDVSPQNILVGSDGVSRLTDFGVVKAEARLAATRSGQIKGKLAYMAPECVFSGCVDQRSDLFSMGIVLWECITGRRLFRADNQAATLTMIGSEPIAAPSAVDPELAPLDAILEKALAREPDRRFQTAVAFMDAIENSASRIGGLASRRAVANLVKKLAREKLDRDRKLIQNAMVTSDINTTDKTPAEWMEGRISHIRIKSISGDDLIQSQDSDYGLEATKAEMEPSAETATPAKISGARKHNTLRRLRLKWLAGGIAGGVIIAIASAGTIALLSTPEPITAHSLKEAVIRRLPSNSPNQNMNPISSRQPPADNASSNTSERRDRNRVNRRHTRDLFRKAKSGDRSATEKRSHQHAQETTSSNAADINGIPENSSSRADEKGTSPSRPSRSHLRTASLRDLPENPFEPPSEPNQPRRKQTKSKTHPAPTSNIPDNPFE